MRSDETAFTLFWMILGVFTWSFLLSHLTAILTEQTDTEKEMNKKVEIVRQFADAHGISNTEVRKLKNMIKHE